MVTVDAPPLTSTATVPVGSPKVRVMLLAPPVRLTSLSASLASAIVTWLAPPETSTDQGRVLLRATSIRLRPRGPNRNPKPWLLSEIESVPVERSRETSGFEPLYSMWDLKRVSPRDSLWMLTSAAPTLRSSVGVVTSEIGSTLSRTWPAAGR